jgi:hypothetical protein
MGSVLNKKLAAVNKFIEILESNKSRERKIQDFKSDYPAQKKFFTQGNDSPPTMVRI